MAKMLVSAEHKVDAPADVVYRYVADMREHHPHFLPPAFSGFRVESGGVGAGTITRFKMTAGGRTRECQMKVAEPEPAGSSPAKSAVAVTQQLKWRTR